VTSFASNSGTGHATPGLRGRTSVKARIYFGFGMLIIMSAAVAAFSVTQFGSVDTEAQRSTALTGNTVRVLDAERLFESMRKDALANATNWDEASVKTFGESKTEMLELLTAAGKATLSEQRRKTYGDVARRVEELSAEFGQFAKLTAGAKDDRTVLFSIGDEVTAATSRLVTAARATGDPELLTAAQGAESSILLVRVANWRFLATHDAKGPATFLSNSQKANEALNALGAKDPPAAVATLIGPLQANLGNYARSFNRVSGAILEFSGLYEGKMQPLIADTFKALDDTKLSLVRDNAAAMEKATATIASSTITQEVAAGISFLVGITLAFLIGRGIVNPITGMTSAMGRLAGGDTKAEIPSRARGDEIGKMAAAVQVFKDSMIETDRLRGERAESERQQARQRKADMIKLADDFEGAVGEIIETVSSASTELEASASTLTSTAERAQELTTMVAEASEEASTNVQSVASATEEMTSSVNEISRQVQESARMANEAVDQARKTNDRVGELSRAAARIGDVVELINTIAGQTNLLALNATIEAARAGEAGRGFAVVASEVKALAEQTAKATGEIGQQISGIQAATQESVGAIREISCSIEKLSEISSTIAAAVEEQGAATQEISRNVQQAAQGTQQVSSHITDVQRGASETGSASSQVLSAAQSLSGDSNRLKLEVGKFLNSVRAA
jgi:methyl-accepting chemotaxis protein